MNRFGQASRFAYNPKLLAAYIKTLPKPECYRDAHHGRILRRWRKVSKGVTFEAAEKFLEDYGRWPCTFEAWCEQRGKSARLR